MDFANMCANRGNPEVDVFEELMRRTLKEVRCCNDGEIHGFCETEEEIVELLRMLNVHGFAYSVRRSAYYRQSRSGDTKHEAAFYFKHMKGSIPIEFFGPVFSIESLVRRQCTLGPMYYNKKEAAVADHLADHVNQRKRKLIMDTKKNSCPAFFDVKCVRVFPEYTIKSATDTSRKNVIDRLKRDLESTHTPKSFVRFYVAASQASCHNHGTDCVNVSGRMHPSLAKEIRSVVEMGTTSVRVIRLHLERFVGLNFTGEDKPDHMNIMFYPTEKAIRDHVYRALFALKKTVIDQDALQNLIDEWKNESRDGKIFFRPFSEDGGDVRSLLFCYQSKWQMDLLKKYGRMCLLDATYKTTKYDIPLFFLVVKANVCYLVVGLFFVQAENRSSIQEGLAIFKGWNPDWSPTSWVTDYSESEIRAIEGAFPESMVYLCSFHREQAWQRWLKKKENLSTPADSNEILSLWRHIAASPSEQQFLANTERLKNHDVFVRNPTALAYFDKQWLSVSARWVKAFEDKENFNINTTKGVESMHKRVKHFFLRHTTDKTLTGVIKVLVKDFIPSLFKNYCLKNSIVKCYNREIPHFLHKKTKKFITHVMKRYSAAETEIEESKVKKMSEGLFLVESTVSRNSYYVVDFSKPDCTCEDFQRQKYPCKHFCAIFVYYPDWGFEKLNENYRNNPLICLDETYGFGLSSSDSTQSIPVIQSSEDSSSEEEMNGGRDNERCPTLSEQQDTRELARRVINLTYNCRDKGAIQRTMNRLRECVQDLESSNPETEGLPLVVPSGFQM